MGRAFGAQSRKTARRLALDAHDEETAQRLARAEVRPLAAGNGLAAALPHRPYASAWHARTQMEWESAVVAEIAVSPCA
jgi:hypothetical protein